MSTVSVYSTSWGMHHVYDSYILDETDPVVDDESEILDEDGDMLEDN